MNQLVGIETFDMSGPPHDALMLVNMNNMPGQTNECDVANALLELQMGTPKVDNILIARKCLGDCEVNKTDLMRRAIWETYLEGRSVESLKVVGERVVYVCNPDDKIVELVKTFGNACVQHAVPGEI